MKLMIAIIDDSRTDIATLGEIIEEWAKSNDCYVTMATYNTSERPFLKTDYIQNPFNIIFVDVMMPVVSGIELIPKLKSDGMNSPMFVLMSSEHNFVKDGYKIEAFDFMCKPFIRSDVFAVLDRAVKKIKLRSNGEYTFYVDKSHKKVPFSDIVSVSIARNYARMETEQGRYVFRASLKSIFPEFPSNFIQLTRSSFVNITKVSSISKNSVNFEGNFESMPLAKAFQEAVMIAFRSNCQ